MEMKWKQREKERKKESEVQVQEVQTKKSKKLPQKSTPRNNNFRRFFWNFPLRQSLTVQNIVKS